MSSNQLCNGIPMPIVKLNRAILLIGVLAAILLQQPLITTLLFLLILPAVLFGRKGSLVFFAGSRLFARRNRDAATESPELMKFNNSIAAILLGSAQVAFATGAPLAGWILSGTVAVAASVALCGFCFGCFLYYQFRLQRFRLFGKSSGVTSEQ
jgi:hypothetical protein